MELRRLIRTLGRLCPLNDSEDWDFPGYQEGPKNVTRPVCRIALCLDLLPEVIPLLSDCVPDLILTHHPFYFGNRKEILQDFPWKEGIRRFLVENELPVYSYHTCFDKAKGGMNDSLLQAMGLKAESVEDDPYLRIAEVDDSNMEELIHEVKKAFDLESVSYLSGNDKPIRRIGLIGGGATGLFPSAALHHCDCFLSGDSSHHQRIEMRESGLNYIELPHECEEKGFLIGMERFLKSIDSRLEILPLRVQKPLERS